MRPFSASCFKYHLNADDSSIDKSSQRFSIELQMSAVKLCARETAIKLNESLFPALPDSTTPDLFHSQPFISGNGTASFQLLRPNPRSHPCPLSLASFNQYHRQILSSTCKIHLECATS